MRVIVITMATSNWQFILPRWSNIDLIREENSLWNISYKHEFPTITTFLLLQNNCSSADIYLLICHQNHLEHFRIFGACVCIAIACFQNEAILSDIHPVTIIFSWYNISANPIDMMNKSFFMLLFSSLYNEGIFALSQTNVYAWKLYSIIQMHISLIFNSQIARKYFLQMKENETYQ